MLAAKAPQKHLPLLKDFETSFREIVKIIDLQVLAGNTIRENDLTQSFADDWWDSHSNLTADFVDKYFFDGQNHKKRARKRIRNNFDAVDARLRKACVV